MRLDSYREITELIKQRSKKKHRLIINQDTAEYPIWVLLQALRNEKYEIIL
jgi:hypothetical protein